VQKPIALIGSDLDLLDDMSHHGNEITGYFSTCDKKIGFKYLGDHTKVNEYLPLSRIIVAIDDPEFRKTLMIEFGGFLSGYISPSAHISALTRIPDNLLVYPNAYISANVELGNLLKISVGSQIHHECKIGDFSVVAPQALILGRVEIGAESFIGSGSKIAPNCRIGSNVIVGMGSNVLENFSDGLKIWGNPAREVVT
jgi:UDP-3-O-[3-hydroxymyristoyl] glucosamine N-acyltransferase